MIYRNIHAQIVPVNVVEDQTEEDMNVVMLGCDSVSRLSFMRHAPDLHK